MDFSGIKALEQYTRVHFLYVTDNPKLCVGRGRGGKEERCGHLECKLKALLNKNVLG